MPITKMMAPIPMMFHIPSNTISAMPTNQKTPIAIPIPSMAGNNC